MGKEIEEKIEKEIETKKHEIEVLEKAKEVLKDYGVKPKEGEKKENE